MSMNKRELIDWCLSLGDVYEDYPFDDLSSSPMSWAVIRHLKNQKSFALIYERNGKLCINLKCDPMQADYLRSSFESVTPAYHMNKVHWNTVTLCGDVPLSELFRQIEQSYDLTNPKR